MKRKNIPFKERVTKLAMQLREVYNLNRPLPTKRWQGLSVAAKENWRRVAEYVLANYSVVAFAQWKHLRDCKVSQLRPRHSPKVCRLVKGKAVCS